MAEPTDMSDEEFRMLTWSPPPLYDLTIDTLFLDKHRPLDIGRHQSPATCNIDDSMGSLGTLPTELISETLSLLDLQTLTDFRSICWRSRALVDGIQSYQILVHRCPVILRALLSTHRAIVFTSQEPWTQFVPKDAQAENRQNITVLS
jgi:hypothetical protein